MRIAVDHATNTIRQVERVPAVGVVTPYNGRYAIPTPDGAQVQVSSTSYVLPQDGGDVASLLAASLLAQYPMYTGIAYNFFLDSTDMVDIDTTATGPAGVISRLQMGRGAGPAPVGSYPNSVAILPSNVLVAPPRPGCLVTNTIDIGVPASTDDFLVWWHIYTLSNREDVVSDYGYTSGMNQPGLRNLGEMDQSPVGLTVSISNDDGVNWTACDRLTPILLPAVDHNLRLCFVNTASTKVYLAAFGILY